MNTNADVVDHATGQSKASHKGTSAWLLSYKFVEGEVYIAKLLVQS